MSYFDNVEKLIDASINKSKTKPPKPRNTFGLVNIAFLVGGALVFAKLIGLPVALGWGGIIAFFWVPVVAVFAVVTILVLLAALVGTASDRQEQKAYAKAVEEKMARGREQAANGQGLIFTGRGGHPDF